MKNHLKNILFCLLITLMFKTTLKASEQATVSTKIDGLIEQFDKVNANQESKWLASLKSPLSIVKNPSLTLKNSINERVKALSLSGFKVAAESKNTKESQMNQSIEATLGESQLALNQRFAELQEQEKFAKELIKRNAEITRIYGRFLHDFSR